ncbi:MAG TPA: GNAT family protein [Polyangiaceae bacterium]|nr:GNAT family protein [Polyangiaceae bacterium]
MAAKRIVSERLTLRPTRPDDGPALVAILREPEVALYWPDFDEARVRDELLTPDEEVTVFAIEHEGRVVGAVQYSENDDPQYRHAGIDIFVGGAWRGRGLGAEAIRAVARHLFEERGHHRLVIDPAAANERAIRAYERVGFRRVGVMRQYERAPDGSLRDGLLMDMLRDELAPPDRGALG